MLRALLGASVTAATLVLLGLPAPAPAAPKCPAPSLGKAIRNADVVFRGVVAKAHPARTSGRQRTRTYTVEADRVYKASLVTDRVVVTTLVGTPCALPELQQGRRYIFFVTEHRARLMATDATGRATPTLTQQVVARLGNGRQPQQTPPAAAEFSKVADASPPALSRLLAPGAALVILSLLGLLVLSRLSRRTA